MKVDRVKIHSERIRDRAKFIYLFEGCDDYGLHLFARWNSMISWWRIFKDEIKSGDLHYGKLLCMQEIPRATVHFDDQYEMVVLYVKIFGELRYYIMRHAPNADELLPHIYFDRSDEPPEETI